MHVSTMEGSGIVLSWRYLSEYWKEYMEFLKVLRDIGCVGIEKWIRE